MEGACMEILPQSPTLSEEDMDISSVPGNDENCPAVDELEAIFEGNDEEEDACEEPEISGKDDSCTVTTECKSEGFPSTYRTMTFNLDGTVGIETTIVITEEEQTLECSYEGSSTWYPEPEEDAEDAEDGPEEAEENNG